jgi:hypothetical protein
MKTTNMKPTVGKTEDDKCFEALAARLSKPARMALVALADNGTPVKDKRTIAALRKEDCIGKDGDLALNGHCVVPFLKGSEPS